MKESPAKKRRATLTEGGREGRYIKGQPGRGRHLRTQIKKKEVTLRSIQKTPWAKKESLTGEEGVS